MRGSSSLALQLCAAVPLLLIACLVLAFGGVTPVEEGWAITPVNASAYDTPVPAENSVLTERVPDQPAETPREEPAVYREIHFFGEPSPQLASRRMHVLDRRPAPQGAYIPLRDTAAYDRIMERAYGLDPLPPASPPLDPSLNPDAVAFAQNLGRSLGEEIARRNR